jgi:DTW domain-containing protein YfiP
MSRHICSQCKRPQQTCICHLIIPLANTVEVIILQHPNEVNQSKGSLGLLLASLQHCTVIVGENFTFNVSLQKILSTYKDDVYLLYPHQKAETIKKNITFLRPPKAIILLDATWKKAYRMYQLSTNLHKLAKLQLPQGLPNYYDIRKTSVRNGLSTLEACCYSLGFLEKSTVKYQPLIKSFIDFNQLLLSFRPTNT